jgi:hypothetical protein
MGGASYNRGSSDQDIGTPRDFLYAVEKRFGNIEFDLAATSENVVIQDQERKSRFFGPGSPYCESSLYVNWANMSDYRVLWLNPPFARIAPFAQKCAEQRNRKGWILMLVPGSIGTNWWCESVRDKAMIYALQPRIKFVGAKDAYPKDLALCAYGYGVRGETSWRWK